MKVYYILSITILVGIVGILPSACEILGVSEQIDTYIGNKSNTNDSDIDNLMGVSPTADPETAKKGWIATSLGSLSETSPLVIDIFPDRKAYTHFEVIELSFKVKGNKSESIKLVLEERNSTNAIVHRSSKSVNETTGNYSSGAFYLQPGKFGVYNVTITAIQGKSLEKASTVFEVKSILLTNLFLFILLDFSFLLFL